jgi:hypothetical protein|tara:strand:+ start:749 stop:976 length:228 start_codon:yes stop_codon:yes gene_type:complete
MKLPWAYWIKNKKSRRTGNEPSLYKDMMLEWLVTYMRKHEQLNTTQSDFVRLETNKDKGMDIEELLDCWRKDGLI